MEKNYKNINVEVNAFRSREMILVQQFFNNFCDDFLFYIHILFLLSFFIALMFVSIPLFLCKSRVVS